MKSNLPNMILLTLVIVVVLHFVYNKSQQCKTRETFKSTRVYDELKYRDKCTSGMKRVDKSKKWYEYANRLELNDRNKNNKKKLIFDDFYEGELLVDPRENERLLNVDVPTLEPTTYIDVDGNEKTVDENAKNIKQYIQNVVLDGNTECECAPNKSQRLFTRDEIDSYRDKQIGFRDNIYGTSSPAEDPVDKMNKIAMKEGIKGTGQTISSFYDNLIKN